ncbi:unnamed protein product [Merluccius merluccius]
MAPRGLPRADGFSRPGGDDVIIEDQTSRPPDPRPGKRGGPVGWISWRTGAPQTEERMDLPTVATTSTTHTPRLNHAVIVSVRPQQLSRRLPSEGGRGREGSNDSAVSSTVAPDNCCYGAGRGQPRR